MMAAAKYARRWRGIWKAYELCNDLDRSAPIWQSLFRVADRLRDEMDATAVVLAADEWPRVDTMTLLFRFLDDSILYFQPRRKEAYNATGDTYAQEVLLGGWRIGETLSVQERARERTAAAVDDVLQAGHDYPMPDYRAELERLLR